MITLPFSIGIFVKCFALFINFRILHKHKFSYHVYRPA